MILVQSGRFDLEWPVAKIIPEFAQNGKEHINFRNLMVHDSGLVPFRPYHLTCSEPSQVMASIYMEPLTYEPGTKSEYSDLGMILIAEAIQRLTDEPLDEFLKREVFATLGMKHTGFLRRDSHSFIDQVNRSDCAPTEIVEDWRTNLRLRRYGAEGMVEIFGDRPTYIQGEVHDPTATVLGGVAGHAGLFSTIRDLGLFLKALMSNHRFMINPDVLKMFTSRQQEQSSRALGWDTKSAEGSSAGFKFGSKSFGHTGYTGTSIWCDPEKHMFSVLLTNRVCPTSKNTKILEFRRRFNEQM
jgi:CubicO group peptidase (beta-lactamase class C family)